MPMTIVYLVIFTSIIIFTMVLIEIDCFTLSNFNDSAWYVLITMTTVGYGDFFTKNLFGKCAMTIATFIGAICTSVYLTAVTNFLNMEYFERQAFAVIQRGIIKNELKKEVALWLACEYKIKLILKIRYASGKKSYGNDDLIYWRS